MVSKAAKGDVEGVRELLIRSRDEAIAEKAYPRVTSESRNDLGTCESSKLVSVSSSAGQSCLSIAAQYDHEELARFLLTYFKSYQSRQEEQGIYDANELDITKRVFNSNPNSRDLKGWTCTAVAVFHHSLRVLRLLLEYGGDPSIRSSYHKNAWDLAKDELDAAERVVKSKSDIRAVLLEFYQSGEGVASKQRCLGIETSLENSDGSAVLMNIEMNNELMREIKESNCQKSSKPRSNGASKKKGYNKGKTKKS